MFRLLLLSLLALGALSRNLLLPVTTARPATKEELETLESFVTRAGTLTPAGSSIALLTSIDDSQETGLAYRVQYLLPGRRVEVIPASQGFSFTVAGRFDTVLLWRAPLPSELSGWGLTRTGEGTVATRP